MLVYTMLIYREIFSITLCFPYCKNLVGNKLTFILKNKMAAISVSMEIIKVVC